MQFTRSFVICIQIRIWLTRKRSIAPIVLRDILSNMKESISLMFFLTHSISLIISFFNMFLLYFGQVVEEIGIFARELRPRGFFGSKFTQVVYADK